MESIAFMGGITSVVVRLGVATLIGCILGVNHDLRDKPAGLRTHGLVALGSALTTITSIQLAYANGTLDGGSVIRAVQGIVAGVGFLGGGVILHVSGSDDGEPGWQFRKRVRGLTTAASVWVAAALGIACGAGQWPSALVALALTLLVLVVGGPLEGAIHHALRKDSDAIVTGSATVPVHSPVRSEPSDPHRP